MTPPHASLAEERERIFAHDWLCVGRVEDLPRPGSFLRAPLTPAGVVVVRQDDGSLRAMHAICTHRGFPLFDERSREEGETSGFRCLYHGLTFDRAGAPCAEMGSPLASVTEPLAPVRVESAHGFVFVCLDERAPPLTDVLGTVPPWLERAGLEGLVRARRVAFDVAANWKVLAENFQESLHFPTVHPELERLTPTAQATTWKGPPTGPWLGGRMPLAPGVETVSCSGRRLGRAFLAAEQDRDAVHDALRFPNLLTSLQPDYLLTFVLHPLDDARTRVVASTYLRATADEDAVRDVTAFWDRVYEQDREACERLERSRRANAPVREHFTDADEGASAFLAQVADRMVDPPSPPASRTTGRRDQLCGIFGRPYLDLSGLVDTSCFDDLHREITRGLSIVASSYTGGSLKWMGVTAPWVTGDPYRDYMQVIGDMRDDQLAELIALGTPEQAEALARNGRKDLALGDETELPLTPAQMQFLKIRHGVYFPWKACYHLLENDRWEDKHSGDGKDFSDEARLVFPRTVAFITALPMLEIGRAVIFGLEANDHAPAHRDSEPGKALSIAQSISFEPSRGAMDVENRHKRFFLRSIDGSSECTVEAPIYWFNDMDWHGVHADPWFRYSVRVDGVFRPDFLETMRRRAR